MTISALTTSLVAFGMPGLPEMMIFLFVVLLLFGGAKLPSLMRNLGRSANEFKRGMNDSTDEDEPVDHRTGSSA